MDTSLAKIIVPAFLAGAGLAVAFGSIQNGAPFAADGAPPRQASEPTPYSADHGRVQNGAGAIEVQPPTF